MDEITLGLYRACKAALPHFISPKSLVGHQLRSAIEMADLGHVPRVTSDTMAADFIGLIEAGHIQPKQMADVLYAMHAAMLDRFEDVALWLPVDLEQSADDVLKAIGLAARSEQDHPEEVAA